MEYLIVPFGKKRISIEVFNQEGFFSFSVRTHDKYVIIKQAGCGLTSFSLYIYTLCDNDQFVIEIYLKHRDS